MSGQLAALGTAFCWSITSLSFEAAGKRVGSLQVNLIRLVFAFLFFLVYSIIVRHQLLPTDADGNLWVWLLLSGLAGFVLGDLFLFRAFVEVGARISMLVYSSVPLITAILGRVFLGERLTVLQSGAMAVTVAGIIIVTTSRKTALERVQRIGRGVWFAFIGAVGQALGLVLGAYGAPDYDVFSATQIRTIAGIIGFLVVISVSKRWPSVRDAIKNRPAMRHTLRGSFFGPFLGVSLGLFAAQHAGTGIAATIIATVPIILIPVSFFLFREKISIREIAGSVIAVSGVAVLFFR